MPTGGRRNAPELQVPTRKEDPTERKRILNVLAQRRYRKHKREHLAALESQVKSPASAPADPVTHDTRNDTSAAEDVWDSQATLGDLNVANYATDLGYVAMGGD